MELTQSYLKSILHYDPLTGVFIRLTNRSRTAKAGFFAGAINSQGYVRIGILGKYYSAHRLAWLYVYGIWPKDQIDHINRIPGDNRIENLRETNNTKNHHNTTRKGPLESGLKGVYRCPGIKNTWRAQIRIDKKLKCLGRFPTRELARDAYCRAASAHYGEYFSYNTDSKGLDMAISAIDAYMK